MTSELAVLLELGHVHWHAVVCDVFMLRGRAEPSLQRHLACKAEGFSAWPFTESLLTTRLNQTGAPEKAIFRPSTP